MRIFTVYACANADEKWLVIDQLPAMSNKYAREVDRFKLTKPNTIITVIITDANIRYEDAVSLCNLAFSHPEKWETTILERPRADPADEPKWSRKRGR